MTVNPGWPVAIALVSLLAVTMIAYRSARIGLMGSAAVASLRAAAQVRTSGVVTQPGAFIGVMLGGGSAVQAATAQVVVLFAIMATQGVTTGVQARLIRARRLLPDDLRRTLVS